MSRRISWLAACPPPSRLPAKPLGHALERVGAGGRVGAAVHAAAAVRRKRQAGAHLQRPVRMVEIVVRAGIDVNLDPGAAAPRAGHHLLADRSRGLVVGPPDQNQRRHPRAPGGVAEAPAAWIKRDRGAEIGTVVGLWWRLR